MIANQIRNLASSLQLRKLSVMTYVAFTTLAVLTLPSSLQGVAAGLDPSWMVGLHLAATNGLVYGSDILFTYGPLGFLMFPLLVSPWLWASAIIVRDLIHMALFISLAAFALRSENRLVNATILGVSAPIIEPLLGTAYTLGVVLLVTSYLILCSGKRASTALLSVVAALSFYIKADIGLLSFTIILVATMLGYLKRPSWRSLAPLAVYAGSVIIAGLILTRSPGTLLLFLLGYMQLVLGYGNAMSKDLMPSWFVIFPLLASLTILALIVKGSSTTARSRLLFGLSVPFLFITYKEGFVREDLHVLIFFASWALFCLLLHSTTARGPGSRAKIVALCLALILLGSGIQIRSMTISEGGFITPITLATNLFEYVRTVYGPSRFRSVWEDLQLVASNTKAQAAFNDTVEATRSVYQLSNMTLAMLRGHTVDVLPWDVSLAYAYGLQWDPAPVFQTYAAYTPYLDELNAHHYVSQGSPDFVLYKLQSIDGRYPLSDEPFAFMALACNYHLVGEDAQFLILERRTSNACGSSFLISVQDTTFGYPVQVPNGNETPVIARVFIESNLLGIVSGLVYKIPSVTISLQYGNEGSQNYRLVAATAPDGLILRSGFLSGSLAALSADQITFSTNASQYYNSRIRVEFYGILGPMGSSLKSGEDASLKSTFLSDTKSQVTTFNLTSVQQTGKIWMVAPLLTPQWRIGLIWKSPGDTQSE